MQEVLMGKITIKNFEELFAKIGFYVDVVWRIIPNHFSFSYSFWSSSLGIFAITQAVFMSTVFERFFIRSFGPVEMLFVARNFRKPFVNRFGYLFKYMSGVI